MNRERVKAGIQRARRQGKTFDRPRAPAAVRHKALQLHEAEGSYRATAALAGVGLSTVQRIVKERRASAGA